MSPPPARRVPPPPARPARSRLVVTIADPADCLPVQVLTLRHGIEESPGDTEIHFRVAGKVLSIPHRVHVGPQFLKRLKGAAGPSWKWEVVTTEPPARKAPPPPTRRTA